MPKTTSIVTPFSGAAETGRRVVYPWLCDQMGHLATQHYMTFFDDAFYHLLSMLGPIHGKQGDRTIGWADVRHEIDYKSELRSGDLVVLKSWITAIGTKSLTHVTHMYCTTDSRLCSAALSRTVRFDLTGRAAIPIEPLLRDRITSLGLLEGSA